MRYHFREPRHGDRRLQPRWPLDRRPGDSSCGRASDRTDKVLDPAQRRRFYGSVQIAGRHDSRWLKLARQIPTIACYVNEHSQASVGFGARRRHELDPRRLHEVVSGFGVVNSHQKPNPPGHLAIFDCFSPSACARRIPVSAPGGRTTTHRFGRPALVNDGESSTSPNPSNLRS